MASFLRRVLTSCSITVFQPAWDSPVWEWPCWKAAAERHDSVVLQCAWPIETHLAVVSTLPNSLPREPVSWDWPLVYLEWLESMPWSGGPAGDSRSSFSRDPWRGGETPSSATFLGGRDWEKCSLETVAPWNTGRVNKPISWGHWRETGTVWCSVYRSSPEGPALKGPGPLASGRSSRRLSSKIDGPQIRVRPGSTTLTPTLILASTRSDIPWMRS